MRSHHPGQSIKYKKKIEKANNRIYERELNKEAQKLWLLKLKNAGPNEKFYTKQVEIKRIKEELKHTDSNVKTHALMKLFYLKTNILNVYMLCLDSQNHTSA